MTLVLDNFFSGEVDVCERLISVGQYAVYCGVLSTNTLPTTLSDDVVQSALEKGTYYRGMLTLNDLPLLQQLQAVEAKFSEIREQIAVINSSIDIARATANECNEAILHIWQRMKRLSRRLGTCIHAVLRLEQKADEDAEIVLLTARPYDQDSGESRIENNVFLTISDVATSAVIIGKSIRLLYGSDLQAFLSQPLMGVNAAITEPNKSQTDIDAKAGMLPSPGRIVWSATGSTAVANNMSPADSSTVSGSAAVTLCILCDLGGFVLNAADDEQGLLDAEETINSITRVAGILRKEEKLATMNSFRGYIEGLQQELAYEKNRMHDLEVVATGIVAATAEAQATDPRSGHALHEFARTSLQSGAPITANNALPVPPEAPAQALRALKAKSAGKSRTRALRANATTETLHCEDAVDGSGLSAIPTTHADAPPPAPSAFLNTQMSSIDTTELVLPQPVLTGSPIAQRRRGAGNGKPMGTASNSIQAGQGTQRQESLKSTESMDSSKSVGMDGKKKSSRRARTALRQSKARRSLEKRTSAEIAAVTSSATHVSMMSDALSAMDSSQFTGIVLSPERRSRLLRLSQSLHQTGAELNASTSIEHRASVQGQMQNMSQRLSQSASHILRLSYALTQAQAAADLAAKELDQDRSLDKDIASEQLAEDEKEKKESNYASVERLQMYPTLYDSTSSDETDTPNKGPTESGRGTLTANDKSFASSNEAAFSSENHMMSPNRSRYSQNSGERASANSMEATTSSLYVASEAKLEDDNDHERDSGQQDNPLDWSLDFSAAERLTPTPQRTHGSPRYSEFGTPATMGYASPVRTPVRSPVRPLLSSQAPHILIPNREYNASNSPQPPHSKVDNSGPLHSPTKSPAPVGKTKSADKVTSPTAKSPVKTPQKGATSPVLKSRESASKSSTGSLTRPTPSSPSKTSQRSQDGRSGSKSSSASGKKGIQKAKSRDIHQSTGDIHLHDTVVQQILASYDSDSDLAAYGARAYAAIRDNVSTSECQ